MFDKVSICASFCFHFFFVVVLLWFRVIKQVIRQFLSARLTLPIIGLLYRIVSFTSSMKPMNPRSWTHPRATGWSRTLIIPVQHTCSAYNRQTDADHNTSPIHETNPCHFTMSCRDNKSAPAMRPFV